MNSDVKVLAHDINNQLQVIRLVVERLINELFKQNTSKKKSVELTRTIEESIGKISSICKEALDGDEPIDMNISKCIQSALEYCNSFEVETDFLKHRDPVVKVTPNAFERILINIFKNSIEASADKIFVELRENLLVVKDNGGGLSSDQFLEFKLGEYTSTKNDGHGLGIQSLYQYCEEMGWELDLSNFDYLHERKKKGLKISITFTKSK